MSPILVVALAVTALVLCAIFGVGLVLVFRRPAPRPEPQQYIAAAPVEPVTLARPGVSLIRAADEAGLHKAGAIVEERLGLAKANDFVAGLTRALAPDAPGQDATRPNA